MAKKKTKNMNFIYMLLTFATGVLTFVAMAFSFIGLKTTSGVAGATKTTKTAMSMSEWFDLIVNFEKVDGIGSWQVSKIFFIITLVLVGLVLLGIVLNIFLKNKTLANCIKVVSLLAIVSALVFFITNIVGCSALSTSVGDTDIVGGSSKYYPHLALYFITLFTIATSVFSFLTLKKSK